MKISWLLPITMAGLFIFPIQPTAQALDLAGSNAF